MSNTIRIEDTNMELFGTPLEHEIKLHAAETEPAFVGAGQQPGLQIWRINKFQLEPVPMPFTGFHSNDSYIVLKTYPVEEKRTPTVTLVGFGEMVQPQSEPKLRHDIHFWLGETTTVDEAGTAAYKTVELDELLSGEPVQHREVQNYESEQFLNYFTELPPQPDGLGGSVFFVIGGGYESGFNHVETNAETKYQTKLINVGHNSTNELPLNRNQLLDTNVLILDTGQTVYQWHGRRSSPFKRNHAATLTRRIDLERNDSVKINVIDQGSEPTEFFEALTPVQPSVVPQQSLVREVARAQPMLDSNGFWVYQPSTNTFQQVGNNVPRESSEVFNANNIVVRDVGKQVWVWVGNNALTLTDRRNAIGFGQRYLRQIGRPASTHISVVKQSNDNAMW